jgi:hypothetical protein
MAIIATTGIIIDNTTPKKKIYLNMRFSQLSGLSGLVGSTALLETL